MLQYGPLKADGVLQPVSGKALPVLRGEVLRIVQEEGEQCVDFNAFNLHDYKEYLGVSNTRSRNAFRVTKGDIIWSVSSRGPPDVSHSRNRRNMQNRPARGALSSKSL